MYLLLVKNKELCNGLVQSTDETRKKSKYEIASRRFYIHYSFCFYLNRNKSRISCSVRLLASTFPFVLTNRRTQNLYLKICYLFLPALLRWTEYGRIFFCKVYLRFLEYFCSAVIIIMFTLYLTNKITSWLAWEQDYCYINSFEKIREKCNHGTNKFANLTACSKNPDVLSPTRI